MKSGISGIYTLDLAKDTSEEINGTLLHTSRDGAIRIIGMNVARDAAAPEKGPRNKRRDRTCGLPVGIMSEAEDLIDRSTAGLGFPIGLCGSEGSGSTVKVGIDSIFIRTNVVHTTHDKKFVRKPLERGHGAVEAFGLERSRDAEAEEKIEGADGNFVSLDRFSEGHFLEERKADSSASEGAKKSSAVHSFRLLFRNEGRGGERNDEFLVGQTWLGESL